MGQFFSDKTEKAVKLIYTQYQHFPKAEKLLKEAAAEGEADAWYFLSIYMLGKEYIWEFGDFPTEARISQEMLKQSVRRGSGLGVLEALRLNVLTEELQKDMPFESVEKALESVMQKAQKGQGYCQYIVGMLYYSGLIEEIDSSLGDKTASDLMQIAVPWLEKSLRQGYYWCAKSLLDLYEKGEYSFAQDLEKYKRCLNMCAASGNPVYEQRLGDYYKKEKDFEKALQQYQSAVKKGHLKAWMDIGYMYERGRGVEKNPEYALKCYEKAAQAGVKRAQNILGKNYYYGRGTKVDFIQAAYWLKQANEPTGYPELADCYIRGVGVDINYEKARNLLEQAEKGGLTLINLGRIYAEGLGVPKDILTGYEYFKQANDQGFSEAKSQMKLYEKYIKAPKKRNSGFFCILVGILIICWVVFTKQTVVFNANNIDEYKEILQKGYPFVELSGGQLANTGSGYRSREQGRRVYGAYFLYSPDGKFEQTFLLSKRYYSEEDFLNSPKIIDNYTLIGKIKKRGETEIEVVEKMINEYGIKRESILDGVLMESDQYRTNKLLIYFGGGLIASGFVVAIFFGIRALALRKGKVEPE